MRDVPEELLTMVVNIVAAIIGVAIIAVILSQGSKTTDVLRTGGQALSSIIAAAMGQGSGFSINVGGGPGGQTG